MNVLSLRVFTLSVVLSASFCDAVLADGVLATARFGGNLPEPGTGETIVEKQTAEPGAVMVRSPVADDNCLIEWTSLKPLDLTLNKFKLADGRSLVVFTGIKGRQYAVDCEVTYWELRAKRTIRWIIHIGDEDDPEPDPDPPGPDDDDDPPGPVPDDVPNKYQVGKASYAAAVPLKTNANVEAMLVRVTEVKLALHEGRMPDPDQAARVIGNRAAELGWSSWWTATNKAIQDARTRYNNFGVLAYKNFLHEAHLALKKATGN